MKLIRFVSGSLILLAAGATASLAQAQRTFVSGLGNDSNPCNRTAPCRTFAQAVSQTNPGGAVVALDSAGYGPLSVNKSISIVSPPGTYAGILVSTGDGIDINAGPADVVNLQGITITPAASMLGAAGVAFNSGGTLRIEGCVVRGFAGGVSFGNPGKLVIKDTEISDCIIAVSVSTGSGLVKASIDRITVDNCSVGIDIDAVGTGTSLAAIRDSSVSGGGTGIRITAFGAGAAAFLDVERCLVANGSTALRTDQDLGGASGMSISNCVISHNSQGFLVSPGTTIFSRGNNSFFGNGPNSGALTPVPAQ